MLTKLDGPFKLPANSKPDKLFVFLHGFGANGFDLIDLSYDFEDIYPNAAFLSPHAPFPNGIYSGYQWFSLNDYNEEKIYNGIEVALPYLDEYITSNLEKFKLDLKDLVLLGFSQGSMMAIQFALRLKKKCHAVICYSGALIKPDLLANEINSNPDIFIVHGAQDQVVPIIKHYECTKALTNLNIKFSEFVDPNLAHSINQLTVKKTKEFLENIKS